VSPDADIRVMSSGGHRGKVSSSVAGMMGITVSPADPRTIVPSKGIVKMD
jgi:hypothetical protein